MNIKETQELKRLHTYESKIKAEIDEILLEKRTCESRLTNAYQRYQNVQRQIEALKKSDPIITEHALLRYLERVKGIDLGQIQKEIMTEYMIDMIKRIHSGKIPIPGMNGVRVIVRNESIVSVESRENHNERDD